MKKFFAALGVALGIGFMAPSVAEAQEPPPQNCEYVNVVFTRNSATETYSSLRDMPTLQEGDRISMGVYFERGRNQSWHSCQFGMALYSHPDNSPERPHLGGTLVDYVDHGTAWQNGPALFYSILIPDTYCGLQLDAYRGKHLTMKDFQNGDRYGDRLISAKNQANGDSECDPPPVTTTTQPDTTTTQLITTTTQPETTTTSSPPLTDPTLPSTTTTSVQFPTTTIIDTTTTEAPSQTTIANRTTSTGRVGIVVRPAQPTSVPESALQSLAYTGNNDTWKTVGLATILMVAGGLILGTLRLVRTRS